MGGHLLEGEFRTSATVTRVVLCGVPSLRARIADVAVTLKEGGFSRQAALGISTLESESSDRGSNPREVSCTPASFDELRSVVRAVGVVLLGLGLFAVCGFSAGLCVGPSFGLYCGPKSWQRPGVFPGGPPPQY